MQCWLVLRYTNGGHKKGWRSSEEANISTRILFDIRKMRINKEFDNVLLMQKGLSVKCGWDLKIFGNFRYSLADVKIIINCKLYAKRQSYQKRRNYRCKHILCRTALNQSCSASRRDNTAPWRSNHVCKTCAFQDLESLSARCRKTQMTKPQTLVGPPWFRLHMTNPSPDNWVAI